MQSHPLHSTPFGQIPGLISCVRLLSHAQKAVRWLVLSIRRVTVKSSSNIELHTTLCPTIIRAPSYRNHHYCNCTSELLTFYYRYQEQKEIKCNSHNRKPVCSDLMLQQIYGGDQEGHTGNGTRKRADNAAQREAKPTRVNHFHYYFHST